MPGEEDDTAPTSPFEQGRASITGVAPLHSECELMAGAAPSSFELLGPSLGSALTPAKGQ